MYGSTDKFVAID